MKTTLTHIMALCFLTQITVGCNQLKKTDEATTESVETIALGSELAAIEATRQQFQLAIKEKRYSDLGSMKTNDMIGIGPASAEWLEYQREREQSMGMFSYDSIIMSPKETVILNDSMAYDFGTSKVYYTNSKGKSIELRDSFMVLLKKEDGRWKMFRELASGTVK